MKKEFEPADGCIDPGICKKTGECFEAQVIRTEIKYGEDEKVSGLREQLEKSKCQHEQAEKARNLGDQVLRKID